MGDSSPASVAVWDKRSDGTWGEKKSVGFGLSGRGCLFGSLLLDKVRIVGVAYTSVLSQWMKLLPPCRIELCCGARCGTGTWGRWPPLGFRRPAPPPWRFQVQLHSGRFPGKRWPDLKNQRNPSESDKPTHLMAPLAICVDRVWESLWQRPDLCWLQPEHFNLISGVTIICSGTKSHKIYSEIVQDPK